MAISRRVFVKAGGLALFSLGLDPLFLARAAYAATNRLAVYPSSRPILVCLFQRGAVDGLNMIVPHGDPFYYSERPRIAVPASDIVDLDGHFGLHPRLAALKPLWDAKSLAIVHGVGSPNSTRSHFDAQDYMESGTPFSKGTSSGWLNRAVGLMGHDATPFRAVSLTSSLPRSFYGDNPAIAISSLQDFAIQLKGNPMAANMAAKSFEELYDQTSSELLSKTGKESFDAVKMLGKVDTKNYQPASGAVYPNTAIG